MLLPDHDFDRILDRLEQAIRDGARAEILSALSDVRRGWDTRRDYIEALERRSISEVRLGRACGELVQFCGE